MLINTYIPLLPNLSLLITEHWKSRVLFQLALRRTTKYAFLFQLRTQRTPYARRRGDLRRQFVSRGDNAPEIRPETFGFAAFAKAHACSTHSRRATIVLRHDLRLLMLHGFSLYWQGWGIFPTDCGADLVRRPADG